MTIQRFNDIIAKYFWFLVPQRKIGSTFTYKNKKYKVIPCSYNSKGIGCAGLNKKDLCAFSNSCNSFPVLKRGRCYYSERKDDTSVSFVEIK